MPNGTDNLKDRSRGDEMTQDECWENEHIDFRGHLHVPLASSLERAPKRKGWTPYFVVIHLDRSPQKHVIYKRVIA